MIQRQNKKNKKVWKNASPDHFYRFFAFTPSSRKENRVIASRSIYYFFVTFISLSLSLLQVFYFRQRQLCVTFYSSNFQCDSQKKGKRKTYTVLFFVFSPFSCRHRKSVRFNHFFSRKKTNCRLNNNIT